MFGWVTSWWSTGSFTGPARNAPNDGKNIKAIFDQRPKQVMVVTEEEIGTIRKGLKKTQINAMPPKSQKPPIMAELDNVFGQGNMSYFEMLRKRRESAKNCSTNITEDNSEQSIVANNDIDKSTEINTSITTKLSTETKLSSENNFSREIRSIEIEIKATTLIVEFTQDEIVFEAEEFQNM
jgi:hypothetical protein